MNVTSERDQCGKHLDQTRSCDQSH